MYTYLILPTHNVEQRYLLGETKRNPRTKIDALLRLNDVQSEMFNNSTLTAILRFTPGYVHLPIGMHIVVYDTDPREYIGLLNVQSVTKFTTKDIPVEALSRSGYGTLEELTHGERGAITLYDVKPIVLARLTEQFARQVQEIVNGIINSISIPPLDRYANEYQQHL